MAQFENGEFIKIPKVMMHSTGIWPLQNPSLLYRLMGLFSVLVPTMLTIYLVMEVLRGFPNTRDIMNSYFVLLAMAEISAELLVFSLNSRKLSAVLENLNSPELKIYDNNFLTYLTKKLTFAKIINAFCPIGYFVSSLFVRISPEFEGKPSDDSFIAFYRLYSRFTFLFSTWNLAYINSLFITCVIIAIAYLDISYEELKFISGILSKSTFDIINDGHKLRKLLNTWVAHHVALEKYIRSVDELFTYNNLLYVITYAILNCVLLVNGLYFSFTSFEFLLCLFVTVVLTGKLSLYCILGQILINMSVGIGDICYMLQWYNGGTSISKNICLIIQRAQRPFLLTAGKFAILSHESLATVLKAMFTYFNVVLQLYGNKEHP